MKKALAALLALLLISETGLGALAESSLWKDRLARRPVPAVINRAAFPAPLTATLSSRPNPVPPLSLSQPTIFLLQDVHMNAEAQRDIAAVLSRLFQEGAVDLLGLEGAFDPFDFDRFRAFPNRRIVARVLTALVDSDVIGGAALAAITSPKAPRTVGVDHRPDYRANVHAYLRSRLETAAVARGLREIEAAVSAETAGLPFLAQRLQSARLDWMHQRMEFGAYAERIAGLSQETYVPLPDALQTFLQAQHLERTVDFEAADRERLLLLQRLASRLTAVEMKTLLSDAARLRDRKISAASFHHRFETLCRRHGLLSPAAAPSFAAYLDYVRLADRIDGERLLDEMAAVEARLADAVAPASRDRNILAAGEFLGLLTKLSRFELTPREWERHQILKARLNAPSFRSLLDRMAPHETFYRLADRRSRRMAEALLAQPFQKGAVLVAGGFHTPLLSRILKARGYAPVIIAPQLTRVDGGGSDYLETFARDKAPLDRLFSGQRLFIVPSAIAGFGSPSPEGQRPARHALAALGAAHEVEEGDDGDPLLNADVQPDGKVRVRSDDDGFDVLADPKRPGDEPPPFSPGAWAGVYVLLLAPFQAYLRPAAKYATQRIGSTVVILTLFSLAAIAEGALGGLIATQMPIERLHRSALLWIAVVNPALHALGVFMWSPKNGRWNTVPVWKGFRDPAFWANYTHANIASSIPAFFGFLAASHLAPAWMVFAFFIFPHLSLSLLTPSWKGSFRRAVARGLFRPGFDRIRDIRWDASVLSREARLDPLSQIKNRFAFEEDWKKARQENTDIERQIENALKFGLPERAEELRREKKVVVLMDANHFGLINFWAPNRRRDGDHLIWYTARTLASAAETFNCRDAVYRYGGDEFTAIVPAGVADDLIRAAERMFGFVHYPAMTPARLEMGFAIEVSLAGAFDEKFDAAETKLKERKKERKKMGPLAQGRTVALPSENVVTADRLPPRPEADVAHPAIEPSSRLPSTRAGRAWYRFREAVAYLVYPELTVEENRARGSRDTAKREAEIDALTGLGNEIAFKRAVRGLTQGDQAFIEWGVILLDLSNFKPVNDQGGYELGNAVLIQTAFSLTEVADEFGVGGRVFRIGNSNKFAVIARMQDADTLLSRATHRVDATMDASPNRLVQNVEIIGRVARDPDEAEELLAQAKENGPRPIPAEGVYPQNHVPQPPLPPMVLPLWRWFMAKALKFTGIPRDEALRAAQKWLDFPIVRSLIVPFIEIFALPGFLFLGAYALNLMPFFWTALPSALAAVTQLSAIVLGSALLFSLGHGLPIASSRAPPGFFQQTPLQFAVRAFGTAVILTLALLPLLISLPIQDVLTALTYSGSNLREFFWSHRFLLDTTFALHGLWNLGPRPFRLSLLSAAAAQPLGVSRLIPLRSRVDWMRSSEAMTKKLQESFGDDVSWAGSMKEWPADEGEGREPDVVVRYIVDSAELPMRAQAQETLDGLAAAGRPAVAAFVVRNIGEAMPWRLIPPAGIQIVYVTQTEADRLSRLWMVLKLQLEGSVDLDQAVTRILVPEGTHVDSFIDMQTTDRMRFYVLVLDAVESILVQVRPASLARTIKLIPDFIRRHA